MGTSKQSGIVHILLLLLALGFLAFIVFSPANFKDKLRHIISVPLSFAEASPEVVITENTEGKVTSRNIHLKLNYPVPSPLFPPDLLTTSVSENKIDPLIDQQIEGGKQSVPVIIKLKTSYREFYEKGQKAPQAQVKSSEFQKKKQAAGAAISNLSVKSDLKIINSISADVNAATLKELLQNPDVESVTLDQVVEMVVFDTTSQIKAQELWGMDASDSAKLTGVTGKGKTIAIIDTGVDYTRPEFGACSAVGQGTNCRVVGGWNFIKNSSDPKDDNAHGTHVAAIAAGKATIQKDGKTVYFYGVAPEANIVAYKVLDSRGSGLASTVIAGIEKALDPNSDGDFLDHLDIINLSLATSYGNPDDPLNLTVDKASAAGVTVVVAAGNRGGSSSIQTPAMARTAITVAASCKTTQIGNNTYCASGVATFSSKGPIKWSGVDLQKPDVSAPGVSICASKSSLLKSSGSDCTDGQHIQLSGTSMAAPHVAGVAALILQSHPEYSPAYVKQAIKLSAKSLGLSYDSQGAGEVVASAAVTGSFPAPTPLPSPVIPTTSPLPSPLFPPANVIASDNFNRANQTGLGKDMQGHKWVSYAYVINDNLKAVTSSLIKWVIKDKQAQINCVRQNNKGHIPEGWALVESKVSDNVQVSMDVKVDNALNNYWSSVPYLLTNSLIIPFRASDKAIKNGNYLQFSYLNSPGGKTTLLGNTLSINNLSVVAFIKDKPKLIGYIEFDPQEAHINGKGSNNFRYFIINNKLTFFVNGYRIVDKVTGKSQIDLAGDNSKGTMFGIDAFTSYDCTPTFKYTNFSVSQVPSLPTHFRIANAKNAVNSAKAQSFVPDSTGTQSNIPWTLTSGTGAKTVFVQFKINGNWKEPISTNINLEKELPDFKSATF